MAEFTKVEHSEDICNDLFDYVTVTKTSELMLL